MVGLGKQYAGCALLALWSLCARELAAEAHTGHMSEQCSTFLQGDGSIWHPPLHICRMQVAEAPDGTAHKR